MRSVAIATLIGLCFLQGCVCHKVLLISLDGFRNDFLRLAKAAGRKISAFEEIEKRGFRAKSVLSVFPTLTFPSHFALVTGRHPESHGLVGNTFWDPTLGRKYKYTDAVNAMESEWYEQKNAEPIWITNERHNHHSGVIYWTSSEARIRNRMATGTFGLYSGYPTLPYRVDRMLDWLTQDDFTLGCLYYNEPDSAGHTYGPMSTQVLDAVESINEGLLYLLQRVDSDPKLKDDLNILLVSDHGMMDVSVNDVMNVYHVVNDTHYYVGRDGSPANLGIWPISDKDIPDIISKLKTYPGIDVYQKNEVPERFHYRDNERIAPIVAVAKLGKLISTYDSPYTNLGGMHGYDNAYPELHPFLMGYGPGLVSLESPFEFFHQVDVYNTVCWLLALDKPWANNGSLARVLPLLTKKPTEQELNTFMQYSTGQLVDES